MERRDFRVRVALNPRSTSAISKRISHEVPNDDALAADPTEPERLRRRTRFTRHALLLALTYATFCRETASI